MKLKSLSKVALSVGLLSGGAAHAYCLNSNADTRLQSRCVAETLLGKSVQLGDAYLLDSLLKREGYAAGIGLPSHISRQSLQSFITPILDYNSNINGGNPNRPLILGSVTFTGEDANLRRSGVVGGLAAGINGRSIYGEGRYFDYAASASYAYSPQHRVGIARGNVNLCSRNHIANQWYVDVCGDAARTVRDLATETISGVSLSTAKLFTTGGGAFHSLSLGVRRHHADEYHQNQLLLRWGTVRNRGTYTAINVSLGEAVPNQLAMRRSLSATVGTSVFNKALTATAVYSYADGGSLMGFERNDATRSVNLSLSLNANLSVSAGYKSVNSSINYYSESEPIFSVQFSPVRF